MCVLMVCKEFMLQSGDAVSGSGGKHMVAMVASMLVAVACSIGGGAGGVANTDHTGVDGGKAWCGWRRTWVLVLVVGRVAQMVEAVSIGGVGDGCGGWHWRHCVVAVVGWLGADRDLWAVLCVVAVAVAVVLTVVCDWEWD